MHKISSLIVKLRILIVMNHSFSPLSPEGPGPSVQCALLMPNTIAGVGGSPYSHSYSCMKFSTNFPTDGPAIHSWTFYILIFTCRDLPSLSNNLFSCQLITSIILHNTWVMFWIFFHIVCSNLCLNYFMTKVGKYRFDFLKQWFNGLFRMFAKVPYLLQNLCKVSSSNTCAGEKFLVFSSLISTTPI